MSYSQINEDNAEYYRFTRPARLDKAIHTLEGFLDGIAADGKVNNAELRSLTFWISEHKEFANRHPFNEIIARLDDALSDGIFDEEERADVLWLCNKFTSDDTFYNAVTSDMQRLHGLLGGIAADDVITKEELVTLQNWLDDHQHLKRIYPFDELDAIILGVLKDGIIDEKEHEALLDFFAEFLSHSGHRAVELPVGDKSNFLPGVCAACPEIEFSDAVFCFTGRSECCSRVKLADIVEQLGGRFSNSTVLDLSLVYVQWS